MHGKMKALARFAAATRATSLLESLPKRPVLLILSYHRIGEASASPFDSGNYSCTAEELDAHILYLKQRFRIVDLEQALLFARGKWTEDGPSVLLTFDDGYLDNFELAFPVLRSHGVSATFFLPTAFIGSSDLPWWDTIAYIVKTSPRDSITLPGKTPRRTLSLAPGDRQASIWTILDLFKDPATEDGDRFIAQIEEACGSARPSNRNTRSFLNWDEARLMQAAGMSFGSHTHTHQILSKLSFAEQCAELGMSRKILASELGIPADTLAYPVGRRDSFSADTVRALKATGYRNAFSFFSGVNRLGTVSPYNILRAGVFSGSLPVMRLRTAVQTITAQPWL